MPPLMMSLLYHTLRKSQAFLQIFWAWLGKDIVKSQRWWRRWGLNPGPRVRPCLFLRQFHGWVYPCKLVESIRPRYFPNLSQLLRNISATQLSKNSEWRTNPLVPPLDSLSHFLRHALEAFSCSSRNLLAQGLFLVWSM